ncbi:MAG: hypothetical protein WC860_10150 [Candidatus Margulisiibacteriota bacterium]
MNNQAIKNFIQNPLVNKSINLLTRLANYSIDKPSSFLKNTAAFAFSFGSVGLIAGLLMNKEVPKKEKRYMICQEAVEGVLDLGVFLTVASKFEQWGETLVKNGLFLPSMDKLSEKQIKTHVTNFFKNPESLPKNIESQIRTHLNCTKIAASFIGTLLAFNIVSPIIRNFAASKIDKLFDKDKNKSNMPKAAEKIVVPNISSEDPFSKYRAVVMKTYQSPKSGGLKI